MKKKKIIKRFIYMVLTKKVSVIRSINVALFPLILKIWFSLKLLKDNPYKKLSEAMSIVGKTFWFMFFLINGKL